MLIQMIHIFYYQGDLMILMWNLYKKSLKYLNFRFWIYFILKLQMALQLRVKFELGSLWNTPQK